MTDDSFPPLPAPSFNLSWRWGLYKVDKPDIEQEQCYTADQMHEYGMLVAAWCAMVCESEKRWRHSVLDRSAAHGASECARLIREKFGVKP